MAMRYFLLLLMVIGTLVLGGCGDTPEAQPAPPEVDTAALTDAEKMLIAMRQSLEESGQWSDGPLSVTAETVNVEPDGAVVLGSSGASRGVLMKRTDPETGQVTAQFQAKSVKYHLIGREKLECWMTNVTTTHAETGQQVTVAELHFQIAGPTGEGEAPAEPLR